jgi:type IV pilus assembly protein PilB
VLTTEQAQIQDPALAILLQEGRITSEQAQKFYAQSLESGKNVLQLLQQEGLIDQDRIARVTAQINNIEFISLTAEMIDPMVVQLVSREVARRYQLIPVRIENDVLYVAMHSPLNLSIRDQIASKTGYHIVPLAATLDAIKQAINHFFNVQSITRQDIVSMRLKSFSGRSEKRYEIKTAASENSSPVVRLVDSVITSAVDIHASDVHIEPQEPDMKVRYRVDGVLIDALEIPASVQKEVISHIKILAEMDISEKRLPQDGHITLVHNDREYDLRVSSLPATGGEKVVIRILDSATGLKKLSQIVTSPAELEQFQKLIQNPYGIILLTGPTGCGKTTTLYSLLQELNRPDRNIVTVENPVEYRIKGLTQVQVNTGINMTFASSLRSILRQDPDIILIGEIRDDETAEIALTAAQTGHLVLSTLHTNTAVGALARLHSLKIPPFHVASALLGVVAQRLVRALCPRCKQLYAVGLQEIEGLGLSAEEGSLQFYKPVGCPFCRNTGYKGRLAIYEILTITPEIRRLINRESPEDDIKQVAMNQSMKTLRQQGIRYVMEGLTSTDELYRIVDMRQG